MIEYMFVKPDGVDCGWNGIGWYFWDETEAWCHGPYESASVAKLKLSEYVNELNEE